jgi:hypothetical protein
VLGASAAGLGSRFRPFTRQVVPAGPNHENCGPEKHTDSNPSFPLKFIFLKKNRSFYF